MCRISNKFTGEQGKEGTEISILPAFSHSILLGNLPSASPMCKRIFLS